MEEQNNQEALSNSQLKKWIQENMRILISIVIVIAIAGGVYSYSQRNLVKEETQELAEVVEEETGVEEMMTDEKIASEEISDEAIQEEVVSQEEQEDRTSSIATSQETKESFIETAGAGDGLTHLARRSLANYLEKNPSSDLTPEHKIYIEDYLRKNVGYNQGIKIGTSVEFSKELIQDAIRKSKELNEKQLQNLHQYSVRVPSLS